MTSSALLPSHAVEISGARTFTTSLMVADIFEKQHKDVLRSIDGLIADCPEDFHRRNFAPMVREEKIGSGAVREFRYFELSKDGFTLLAMGYTGPKAMQFKLAYIARFNAMEAQLHPRSAPVATPAPAPAAVAIDDAWVRSLREYLEARLAATPAPGHRALFVPMIDLVTHLGHDPATMARGDLMRIGRIAQTLGWRHAQIRLPERNPAGRHLRQTGYRPGPSVLNATRAQAPAPRSIPVYDHRDPRVNGDLPPPPDPLAHPDVRKAINRRAHSLSLLAFEHNREIIEAWLRRDGDLTDPEAAIERIHTLDLDHGKHLMVDIQQLWAVTSHVAATERCLAFALDAIRTLEQSTGKRLYGRTGEA